MKEIKCDKESRNLRIEEIITLIKKFVNNVEKNIWKRRTLTGLVEHIE